MISSSFECSDFHDIGLLLPCLCFFRFLFHFGLWPPWFELFCFVMPSPQKMDGIWGGNICFRGTDFWARMAATHLTQILLRLTKILFEMAISNVLWAFVVSNAKLIASSAFNTNDSVFLP